MSSPTQLVIIQLMIELNPYKEQNIIRWILQALLDINYMPLCSLSPNTFLTNQYLTVINWLDQTFTAVLIILATVSGVGPQVH